MAGLYVMVAYSLSVVTHTFQHACHGMSHSGLDKIIEIDRRLALQYVAVVEQHHAVFAKT